MIDSKIIVHIKTDKKNQNVDFVYSRKDLIPLEDKNEMLLVMYAEQIVRSMIESGMIAPKQKGGDYGKKVSEQ